MFETPTKNSKEEELQQSRRRLDKIKRLDLDYISNSNEKPIQPALSLIKAGIKRQYPDIPDNMAYELANKLTFADEKEKFFINKQDITSEDLAYRVAHSIEILNSETYTSEEYFRWIEHGSEIIKKMNDGEVTVDDLKDKTDFLGSLNQREAELMVCMALYQKSQTGVARVRFEELRNKLNKLREIRSAIETSTKNEVDKEKNVESRDDRLKAVQLYGAVVMIHLLTVEEKEKLGMAKGDYNREIFRSRTYAEKLENRVKEEKENIPQTKIMAEEYVFANNITQTPLELAKHIEQLRGRLPTEEDIEKKKKREEIRKRMFDMQRFMVLNGSYNENVNENAGE